MQSSKNEDCARLSTRSLNWIHAHSNVEESIINLHYGAGRKKVRHYMFYTFIQAHPLFYWTVMSFLLCVTCSGWYYLGVTRLAPAQPLHRQRACSWHASHRFFSWRLGAKLTHAVSEAGIGFEVVRLWRTESCEEARALERKLKDRHEGPKLCTICQHKPPDPLAGLRQGHWPMHLHGTPGPRHPTGEHAPRFMRYRQATTLWEL